MNVSPPALSVSTLALLFACSTSDPPDAPGTHTSAASAPASSGATKAAPTAPPSPSSSVALSAAAASRPPEEGLTRETDGAVMVYVPAGAFTRGSPENVGDDDEQPQRPITLKAFFIDRLETTRAQYAKCVASGACKAPVAKDGAATKACNWRHQDRDDHPINCVDHQDATEYCRWAGARLPTEAEWEKAARGTDGRSHPWGNAPPTCELAVMPTPAGITGCGDKTTMPVGSKPKGASPYGALDMSGNVWEWVSDFYGEDYYAKAPASDPTGPASGPARGLRGGAWEVHDVLHLRAANRYRFAPTYRFHALGIRCAKDAE